MNTTDDLLGIGASEASSPANTQPPTTRYSDAYITARAIARIGGVIKFIGMAFGVLLILVGFIAGSNARGFEWVIVVFGSLIIGTLGGIILYVIGVLVSAQGQILKATLDTAVHSSPFLTDDERASVMNLTR